MPRVRLPKIVERERRIMEYLSEKGYATTEEIMAVLGLTHSQAYYVLQTLYVAGRLKRIMLGGKVIWMTREIVGLPAKAEAVRKIMCEIARESKGSRVCMRQRQITSRLPDMYRQGNKPHEILDYMKMVLNAYEVEYEEIVTYGMLKGNVKRNKVIICVRRDELKKICGQ